MDYEKLGLFYLGKEVNESTEDNPLLLYSSADLCTHALCVGMTGSGKTGLCIGLLEEAAIDKIPAIIIDPKGDMANLCLTFPEMKAEDFEPWVDEEEASRKGLSKAEFASKEAENWREGLASWQQNPERINLLRENAELTVFTPGSTTGEPLSILNLFSCPPKETLADTEGLSDLVTGTASSLLGLLGMQADAMQSREHILLSNLFLQAWKEGRNLDLPGLIAAIQRPPFDMIGVMSLDAFFPEKDRFQLALRFNNLLASPSFSSWLEGFPLDIDSLLWNKDGKPRHAIISIAHLDEAQRMFFVSLLLNQLLAWTRRQNGSSSLRALFYMDEIFGYFPPVANPPSKKPLLTLLKQARAYGLGVVLTTQNPVDLDYKGLANIGTWMIGRLQTENDRARLLDGLQGMMDANGKGFSRSEMDKLIANLNKRCFLLNNIHEAEPVIFQTRWALSYLRGPMSREEIKMLKDKGLSTPAELGQKRAAQIQVTSAEEVARQEEAAQDPVAAAAQAFAAAAAETATVVSNQGAAPASAWNTEVQPFDVVEDAAQVAEPQSSVQSQSVISQKEGGFLQVPAKVDNYFLPNVREGVEVKPAIGAVVEVFFKDKDGNMISEKEVRLAKITENVLAVNWADSEILDIHPNDISKHAPAGVTSQSLPAPARDEKNYKTWQDDLIDYIFRNKVMESYENRNFKVYSNAGEEERDFVIRLTEVVREERDKELAKVKERFARKIATAEERLRKAEQAVEREEDQAKDAKRQTAISLGATVIGALLGRKKFGSTTFTKAATAGRSASRAARADSDISRAEATLEAREEDLKILNEELEEALNELQERFTAAAEEYKTVETRPLKRDINVRLMGVFWTEA